MPESLPTPLIGAFDLLGVAVFALSGALVAAREKQTFVTMAFFALVTGVGGGTIRDMLIGIPAFWVRDPWIAPVCLGVAMLVWFTPTRWWERKALDYTDALGLTAYAVLGTAKAVAYGIAPVPAVLMGVVTGTVGGVIRDVIAGRPSILMKPEMYVTAAFLSASVCSLGLYLDLPRVPVWIVATLAGLVLRWAAIRYSLVLQPYSSNQ